MDVFLSDFDTYSDSSLSSDQEDDDFIYSGQASCILSNLEETIGKIDDFFLFERRYVHGDVVCFLKHPNSHMGKVTNIHMTLDLESVVNHKKLKDVNSNKLHKIRSVSVGDYVISGPWVGRAQQITDSVTVLFDDGVKSEFTVSGMDMKKLPPISQDLVDDQHYPYYPGQRVKAVTRSNSKTKPSNWFCGSHNQNQDEGTVCTVESLLVHVNWLACALFSDTVPVPPSLQTSKDLTPLSCFSNSNWQLGDWCAVSKSDHSGFMDHKHPDLHSGGSQEIFVIAKMKCRVDVLWQDGSESSGLDSSCLTPINTLDAHDFWPHQFVLEKETSDSQQDKKWGVVKAVDANEKTARVKWESETEETVSVYELNEHPDYSYSQGDLVFRLHKGQSFENVDYLAHIGIVIGLKNGFVEVKWAAGSMSKVAPHEIFRVEKSEGVSATQLLNSDNIEPNQEKSEHGSHLPDPTQEKGSSDSDDDDDDDEKDCLKTLYDSSNFDIPRAAIGFLSDVAARLLGFPLYTSLSPNSGHVSQNGSVSGCESEEDNQMLVDTTTETKFKEAKEFKDVLCLATSNHVEEIRQFDMVSDCSNHHFVGSPGKGSITTQVKKCWLKKVQQEWNILANDLPEMIYVRVFEERMDLLQSVIIGAPGTPYHDCLFFFDIFLPPEYPDKPPMVHYKSGGLRVNPNLYESGRVCLSLLNTWTGTGTEAWNPDGSTILQVLLSLQALVLNKDPYFNEAGYEIQVGSPEGEKNSCTYNENAFLMTCKSMLYILRNPPKHFEALVEEHFSKRCKHVLMACKAYLEGVSVGCAFESQYVESEGQKGNSTGFKIMLSKLVPKLVGAFTAKGFDCGEFCKTG